MTKKILIALPVAAAIMIGMIGCSESVAFDKKRGIYVVTREAGSGTRGAFVELTGILVKEGDNKKDNTTKEALTIDGTQAVMSNVGGNEYAIGYISLGSLNASVKAVPVNGFLPSASTIKDETYPIARPFNIAVKDSISQLSRDFINFILSDGGQKIVEANGYVAVAQGTAYESTKLSGKIVIAGSSSVSPVMEKLKEAYLALNPNVEIEIQTNDSSSGMLAAVEGTCDIGMASRELKPSELANLRGIVIARDGIAIIVNKKNPLNNITMTTLREVYMGAIRSWEAVVD